MPIRAAVPGDVPGMLEIYRPYVERTAVTFDWQTPSEAEFLRRFETVTQACPWLVWEQAGELLGYACAAPAFEKAAYAWCADVTIYLRPEARGRGIGTALYRRLEALLREQGYQILYALVTADNLPSIRFHEALGFVTVGTLADSGYKLGRWHSVMWMQKRIRDREAPKGFPNRPGTD